MHLLSEVQAMQNPALGSGALWRFCCGYSPSQAGRGTPLPLVFLVLPVVLHAATADEVVGTRSGSGLRQFEGKFDQQGDVLLSLQARAVAMRSLTLKSLE